ncbi:hypothetical protein PSEUDO8Z_100433 [Pseudomonas sp. 8Z]|nr:hypothetical protein PSEUDO8Z_100433 [Pseudomonas sp. 8Z]
MNELAKGNSEFNFPILVKEGGRPVYPLMVILRVHLLQYWFGYSDPAMEEALYETMILRQFAGLSLDRIPDETTILNFRHLLERHDLAVGILGVINGYLGSRGLSLRQGTIVDATLIHAPTSTKNKKRERDPQMHQTKKGNQYYFGAKAHIGSMWSRAWCTTSMSRRPMLRMSPRWTSCCTVKRTWWRQALTVAADWLPFSWQYSLTHVPGQTVPRVSFRGALEWCLAVMASGRPPV